MPFCSSSLNFVMMSSPLALALLDSASCHNRFVWCRCRIATGARDAVMCVIGELLRHCWAARLVLVRVEMDRGIDLEQVWKALRIVSNRRW